MKNKKYLKEIPLAIALALNSLCVTAQFNPIEELSGLNDSNGFLMNGFVESEHVGRSVSEAGDINGDGIDDIIIGASSVATNGFRSGAGYVVFGNDVIFADGFEGWYNKSFTRNTI